MEHSVVLTEAGEVYTMGHNHFGELGHDGYGVKELSPLLGGTAHEARGQVVEVFAGDHVSMARTRDGAIFHWGRGVGPVPTEVQL